MEACGFVLSELAPKYLRTKSSSQLVDKYKHIYFMLNNASLEVSHFYMILFIKN